MFEDSFLKASQRHPHQKQSTAGPRGLLSDLVSLTLVRRYRRACKLKIKKRNTMDGINIAHFLVMSAGARRLVMSVFLVHPPCPPYLKVVVFVFPLRFGTHGTPTRMELLLHTLGRCHRARGRQH